MLQFLAASLLSAAALVGGVADPVVPSDNGTVTFVTDYVERCC